MEYMLNSTLQRVGFSKIRAQLTPGTVSNFVGLAEGDLENKVNHKGQNFITD
jgi:hypothetical protein